MKRRSFIKLCTFGCYLAPINAYSRESFYKINQSKHMYNIGKKYLKSIPADNSVIQLEEYFYNGKSTVEVQNIRRNPCLLYSYINEKSRTEFVNENIYSVDGWIMSKSEVIACSLVYLGAL
jgi:hypothetical protein